MRSSCAHGLLLAAATAALAACGSDAESCNPTDPGCGSDDPTVSAITVTASIDTVMAVGRTTQLAAAAIDATGSPVPVSFSWSSTSTSVATVDGNGAVSAEGEGSTSIEVRADGVVGAWSLRVVDADLDGVTALLTDPFAEALIGTLDATSASAVGQFAAACRAAVDDGDVLLVRACLEDAVAVESSDTSNDPALAVLDLIFQESLRKLRLEG